MKTDWRQVTGRVWARKWEAILGIVGIALAVGAGVPIYLGIFAALIAIVLVVDLIREVRTTIRLVREKHVPLIVIVGKGDDEFHAMVDDVWAVMAPLGFNEREFDADWDVERDDLVVRRESDLPRRPERWVELARRFERKVARLSARLQGRTVFHLFLNCPAALAVGMGALLGSRYEVVLHHLQRGVEPSPYVPVIDFSQGTPGPTGVQAVKRRAAPPYKFIAVEQPEDLTGEVFVSLHLAGHDPKGNVEALAAEKGLAAVHIRNTYGSVLSTDADWLRVAQEVVTELLGLVGRGVQRVHLCLSSPVVLAFAMGMALGTQSPITVYNWFAATREYRSVLELEHLRG
ncbi:MAG TPA: SAVED domain-containing protein [Anaerolineales bacterium]|nr:SAVED domain-containing protein [Anaerolineales bacterium]